MPNEQWFYGSADNNVTAGTVVVVLRDPALA
jgi:hypothetical protein